jgi:hypothetical protein
LSPDLQNKFLGLFLCAFAYVKIGRLEFNQFKVTFFLDSYMTAKYRQKVKHKY